MNSSSIHVRIAVLAALVASLGDLILLYVANAQRSELGLAPIGKTWLWLGGALGVVAIPLYALGYRCVANFISTASESGARALFVLGTTGAILGGVIHGLTAVYIDAAWGTAASAVEPLAAVMNSGSLMLALWAIASVAVLVASLLFARYVGTGRTAAPRFGAFANPALVTVVLSVIGAPFVFGRAFLVPAAPNLAHFVFFAFCLRAGIGAAADPIGDAGEVVKGRV